MLKGIETGDEASVAVVNEEQYIQHNPQTHEGSDGLAALFKRLSKTSPRVNIVRIFADGNFVFGHTEYDFGSPRVGFEVFRFDGDQAVEHWDNIQPRMGPNLSGHSMVDGPTEVSDPEYTELNRELVRSFTAEVLIGGATAGLCGFVDDAYTEHNPRLTDGLPSLRAALTVPEDSDDTWIRYDRLHKLLAEGDFVLTGCEGYRSGVHTAFYDLYRIVSGSIVEHWDTTEAIPPRSEWRNQNGKF